MNTTDQTIVDAYRRAQDGFDAMLAEVPSDQWDAPSACEDWTARDVVGHVTWGQELLRHLAAGEEYTSRAGAPGAEHPGEVAGNDPLTAWRSAREAADARLTHEGLNRPAPPPFLERDPQATVQSFLNVLFLDLLAHTWDVGQPLGMDVKLEPDLLTLATPIAHQIVVRGPGMFGPEQTPTPDADEQTRWLAFLGRSA